MENWRWWYSKNILPCVLFSEVAVLILGQAASVFLGRVSLDFIQIPLLNSDFGVSLK
jgi:hypothetical protein